MMLPASTTRVPRLTAAHIEEQIRRGTEQSIARCAAAGCTAIDQRQAELEHEWDIERTLEANATTIGLVSLTLGATVDRRWFLFPTMVAAFLLQPALQGWCPPLRVFRCR